MNVRASLLLLTLTTALPSIASAAPGDVDATFGNSDIVSGWTRVGMPGIGNEHGVAFARASNGGYVTLYAGAGGINGRKIGLMRFDSEGGVDMTFGIDGRREKDAGLIDVVDMIIDSAGRIVVAGIAKGMGNAGDFALLRFNADGSDDLSFDGDGMMTAGFELPDASDDIATALAQQSAAAGSRYIVAGSTTPLSGTAPTNPVLLGVLPTGQLDPVFGNTAAAGRSYLQYKDDRDGVATTVVVTPDNWIVVAGWVEYGPDDIDIDTDMAALLLAPAGLALGNDNGDNILTISVDVEIGNKETYLDVVTAASMSGPDDVVIVGDAGGRMFAARLHINIGAQPSLTTDSSIIGSGPTSEPSVFVGTTTGAHAADVTVDLHGNLLIAGSVGEPRVGALQRLHFNGIVPAGGGLRTYRAPSSGGPLAFHTEFSRIALDAGRPMLFGSATDNDGLQLVDFDGVLTRLAPEAFVDYIFVDAFEYK